MRIFKKYFLNIAIATCVVALTDERLHMGKKMAIFAFIKATFYNEIEFDVLNRVKLLQHFCRYLHISSTQPCNVL